jgi:hypothetical protein
MAVPIDEILDFSRRNSAKSVMLASRMIVASATKAAIARTRFRLLGKGHSRCNGRLVQ